MTVYMKKGLPFARGSSFKNSGDSHLCFRLTLLHWVSYFFYFPIICHLPLWWCFLPHRQNSFLQSFWNVFIFGDFSVFETCLSYSSGTDASCEIYLSLPDSDCWHSYQTSRARCLQSCSFIFTYGFCSCSYEFWSCCYDNFHWLPY